MTHANGLPNGNAMGARKPLVVQKFGGTSVGTGKRMLEVSKIVRDSAEQDAVVVVLSAMSSYVKADGTTSRLIRAASEAVEGNQKEFAKILNSIKTSHLVAIHEALGDTPASQTLQEEINEEIDQLRSFLEAIAVIGELSPRSNDVVLGLGEKLSARIFATVLREAGADAEYINLDNVIEKSAPFTQCDADFFSYLRRRLAEVVGACKSKIPVVTGFFGFVPNGIIESVGRGYTDFTAALVAAGLGARELQIWKEVDGIFTADPRKVEGAVVLPRITPGEAAELTFYGSEVIHPFTMEQVIREKIPIRIKNTFRPAGEGTVIDPNDFETPAAFKRGAVAVTSKENVTVINLHSNRKLGSQGFFAQVFTILERNGISIDLISTSEVNISMTVGRAKNIDKAVQELESIGQVSVNNTMAIVSLVGHGMKSTVGVAGEMFCVLGKSGINIEMISQGASEINISCVIDSRHTVAAMRAIHDHIILQKNTGDVAAV